MIKKQEQNLLTLLGMAGGAIAGGPSGAIAGGSLAGMAGPMMGPGEKVEAPGALEQGMSGALQRRLMAMNESPLKTIADSIDSLKYIQDPGQRSELAKPLLQAQYLAQNKQEA